MPEATFWFSSPFREWIGQRTLTVRWEGRITLREVLERLAADHVRLRANLTGGGLQQESFNNLAAVMVDGDFLALDAVIPNGAQVNVFTPLAGGGDLATPPRFRAVPDFSVPRPPPTVLAP
jgi:molybdopterin converting factor small subunit